LSCLMGTDTCVFLELLSSRTHQPLDTSFVSQTAKSILSCSLVDDEAASPDTGILQPSLCFLNKSSL
jgi:hypothetical protein